MSKRKVCVTSVNTCPRRNLDASRFISYFERNGYKIVKKPQNADLTVLCACGNSDFDCKVSVNIVNKLLGKTKELIVYGCITKVRSDELYKKFNGKALATKDILQIDEYFTEHKVKMKDIPDPNVEYINYQHNTKTEHYQTLYNYELQKRFFGEHILRISNGCTGTCSYCGIKLSTGNLRSKPLDELKKEYDGMFQKNVKLILIEAEDTGAYGVDIGSTFIELCKTLITGNPDDVKWFIKCVNPKWLVRYSDELVDIFASNKIRVVEIPIQSANPRILKLMNRYTDLKQLEEVLVKIKQRNKDLQIWTHMIVGFPSETVDDIIETANFCKRLKFNLVQVHPYIDLSVGESRKIEPKVLPDEIDQRIEIAFDILREQKSIRVLNNRQAIQEMKIKDNVYHAFRSYSRYRFRKLKTTLIDSLNLKQS